MADRTKIPGSADFLESVIIPKETRTYKPVEHKQLIDITREGALKAGFEISKETYTVAEKGLIATGYYDLKCIEDKDMGIRIAWQNSYNKSVTLKFAIGGRVFVCTNGCFSGSLGAFKRKHTGDVQVFTPSMITEYFKTTGDTFSGLISHKEQLKEIELTKKVTAELIGDMYINENIIKAHQVGIIKKEIEAPSFDYGAPGSAWEAYNHITHALKSTPPGDYIDTHQETHQYFVDRFGLKSKFDQIELVLS